MSYSFEPDDIGVQDVIFLGRGEPWFPKKYFDSERKDCLPKLKNS